MSPAGHDADRDRQHIVLFMDGILPQYLRVTARPLESEWDVREVAIYATEADARVGSIQGCLADDITLDELPLSSRLSLWAALSAWQHGQDLARAERRRQLAVVMT